MLQQMKSACGAVIEYEHQSVSYPYALDPLLEHLDTQRGALFASSFEYPGRYTCWDIGFYNPPLSITAMQNELHLLALNTRGEVLLTMIAPLLVGEPGIETIDNTSSRLVIAVHKTQTVFMEEERSLQPSVFTVLRKIMNGFKIEEDYLGLYGAFGYDLVFQFEAVKPCHQRESQQRDMVLYWPDEILVINHRKEEAFIRRYDFYFQGKTTKGLARTGESLPYTPEQKPDIDADHQAGEYARLVEKAKDYFARGDLFEVVPSQTFYRHCLQKPSALFRRMRAQNPSPYGFLMNLGHEEYLVGASPEMYVRVQGKRIETCPISGTIKRGEDAIEDARNIQTLLDSEKEASELTMCTDVDRNDKSRICEAGSVQVIGRRQIELYSRLIHTVDHVEGRLREGFDAIDAFLTHMWVVTVTGAPKLWAMNFIEQHEKSPRKWYGGAVGWFNFNGNLNTGLVLRTFRIERGVAEIRVGATLLYDSDPKAEEAETQLKASAFLELLNGSQTPQNLKPTPMTAKALGKKVLLIDHQDSFVHTLANYFRQTGAQVITVRYENAFAYLEKTHYDLVVLSPGPGRPDDFNLDKIIGYVLERKMPLFGVCLGLQGIVEYFGGRLDVLGYPMHGKTSNIKVVDENQLFAGIKSPFKAGRYHSLYAPVHLLPSDLQATAVSEDGVVMAVAHQTLPVRAVQFHPETILTMQQQAGLRIISNLMDMIDD